MTMPVDLHACADQARDWLFNSAAPLWCRQGISSDGQFVEKLTLHGEPARAPLRLRVQARQIYAFCETGRLGWSGPWRDATERGLDRLLKLGRRDDGFFVHTLDEAGRPADARADLYDHAFVLFALAHAASALGRSELIDLANEITDLIDARWKNPGGGYNEGEIDLVPPRWQNPHMHLFEAALALHEVSGQERWRRLAAAMFDLCVRVFLDPQTGALREYFTLDWQPASEQKFRTVEPGHCFEWAWLFHRFKGEGYASHADKMMRFARAHGIDKARGIAFYSTDYSGAPVDRSARLWAQTERLKAALARWRRTKDAAEDDEAVLAYRGLAKYFETPVPGVWHDRMRADGTFVEEDAPASSFYHIVCALSELIQAA